MSVTVEDIVGAYRILLNREAVEQEIRDWSKLVNRVKVSELANRFVAAHEFQSTPLWKTLLQLIPRQGGQNSSLVEVDGRRLYVDPDDMFVGSIIFEHQMYEPHLTKAISQTLVPGDTFVDVGCNIGWFTLLASTIVGPAGSVLAADAEQYNVEMVNRSVHVNGLSNVTALSVALADRPGQLVLQHLRGSNALVLDVDEKALESDRYVSCVPLDMLTPAWPRIDVIKIDVEGAELLVLIGAEETVRQHRPIIFCEFNPYMVDRLAGSNAIALDDWIRQHDYAVEVVGEDGDLLPVAGISEAAGHAVGDGGHVDLKLTPSRR